VLGVYGRVQQQRVIRGGALDDALDLPDAADAREDVDPRDLGVELSEHRAGDLLGRVARRVGEDHDLLLGSRHQALVV
jgi:hypothetical protein